MLHTKDWQGRQVFQLSNES